MRRLRNSKDDNDTFRLFGWFLVFAIGTTALVLAILAFTRLGANVDQGIRTINGISPTPGPQFDFSVAGSSHIAINPIVNGIEVNLDCGTMNKLNNSCVQYDISGSICSAGGFLSSQCMYPSPTFTTLDVEGATTLGNETSCAAPLNPSCLAISGQSCPAGPLAGNCIPSTGLVLQDLTVYNLNVLNASMMEPMQVFNGSVVEADHVYLGELHCTNPPNGTTSIPQTCYDISGAPCPGGALSEACIPNDMLFQNLQSTNTLTVNLVTCTGSPVPDNCMQPRIKTINGISPTPGFLDFSVTLGSGALSLMGLPNGIVLDLAPTGVVAASYGSATQVATFTVNAQGQLTSAANVAIAFPPTTISHAELSSATDIMGFSSAAWTIVTGMSTTPAAGMWHLHFSSTADSSSSSTHFEVAVFVDAVQIFHSTRIYASMTSQRFTIETQALITATGSSVVSVRWRKTMGSGNIDMHQRSAFLFRLT